MRYKEPGNEETRKEHPLFRRKKRDRAHLRERLKELFSSSSDEEQRDSKNFKTFEELLAEEQGEHYYRLLGKSSSECSSSSSSSLSSKSSSSLIKYQKRALSKPKRDNPPDNATQEEAIWRILDMVNHPDWRNKHLWHSEVVQILRQYPVLKKETYFSKDFGALSIFNHFVIGNASIDNLQDLLRLVPGSIKAFANSKTNTYPLHIACQCADRDRILFLANKCPQMLNIATTNCGLPLHHAFKREQFNLDIVKTVVELNPSAVIKPNTVNGRSILEWAIRQNFDHDILEYIVQQVPSDIDGLTLEEHLEDEPWNLSEKKMRVIVNTIPRLKCLTIKVRNWMKDGILYLLTFLTNHENHLARLHLEVPDDVHFRHWNGGVLESLQLYLETTRSLNDLTISIGNKIRDLIADAPEEQDKIFDAIVSSIRPSLERIEWRNLALSKASSIETLLCRKAPTVVKFVDLRLRDRTWTRSRDWGNCRVQHLTFEGSCRINCFDAFMRDVYNAPHLKTLTLALSQEDDNQEEHSSDRLDVRCTPNEALPPEATINQSTIDRFAWKGVIVRMAPWDDNEKITADYAESEPCVNKDKPRDDESLTREDGDDHNPQRALSESTSADGDTTVNPRDNFSECLGFLCCYVGPI